jgi:predicted permease
VISATLSESSLIGAGTGYPIGVPGKPQSPDNRIFRIGPNFFHTMQIPILSGRDINEHDRLGSPNVAVINENFAKANFGDASPLGQHLLLTRNKIQKEMEIVGVARNSSYGGLKHAIPPVVYFPYDQGYPEPNAMTYELRTSGDPLSLVNSIRDIVRHADARVPLSNVVTQTAEIDQTINQEIVFAELCSAFAILALIIACVGLYGTVSYSVARRTGEIGIRMALGARRPNVVWMVLRDVLVLVAIALAISVPTALGSSKLVASFLYGMKPNDPITLATAIAILLAAAILAGWLPARHASRIDPMVALRNE